MAIPVETSPFERDPVAPVRTPIDWPLAMPKDPLWRAAVEADAEGAGIDALPTAWRRLADGEVQPWRESVGLERMYLIARANVAPGAARCALTPTEVRMVARVLAGDSQKSVAADLRIAPSTISTRCRRAFGKLGLGSRAVSLPLVLAAQAWAGVATVPRGRRARFEHQGCACEVVSIPRPDTGVVPLWTQAEREVAQLLMEGHCRQEIARYRSISEATVANQVHSVFAAVGVTGRYALIRRACELGCFAS